MENENKLLDSKLEELRELLERHEASLLEDIVKLYTDEIYRLEAALKDINFTDFLTNLGNRRRFFFDVYKLVKIGDYNLTMMDFNNFKIVNDEFGHAKGDEMLEFFSNLLKKLTKDKQSHIYRLGGDEFALLTPVKQNINFDDFFNKINEELKQFHERISMTYGTVLITKDNCNKYHKIEESMHVADKLMYEMKKDFYKKNNIMQRQKNKES